MRSRNRPEARILATLLALLILQACAGDYSPINSSSSGTSSTVDDVIGKLNSVRVSFHYSDYYSLASPHPDSQCAGDAKSYYHALGLTLPSYPTGAIDLLGGSGGTFGGVAVPTGSSSPMKLPASLVDSSTTTHPSFIRNVSVDLTNANSESALNNAFGCSMGTGPGVPQSSSCATFDYGAIGGLPTNLGGTLLMIGGLHQSNYFGIQSTQTLHGLSVGCGPASDLSATGTATYANSCETSFYALGINTLPATAATDPPNETAPGITSADGPLSTWGNLATTSNYSGPKGLVGAGVGYDRQLQRLLLMGGSSPLSSGSTRGAASPTKTQWLLNIKNQNWTSTSANDLVSNSIQTMLDDNSGTVNLWQKASSARTDFGYRAAQGFALSAMSTTGNVSSANIDLTDRILMTGGYGTYGYDTRKFNPTYGPDWIDRAGAAGELTQWLDNYHTQLVFNHVTSSGYLPGGGTSGDSGFVALRDNATGSAAGYLLAAKGFGINATTALPEKNAATTGGVLSFLWRGSAAADLLTSAFSMVPAYPNGTGTGTQGTWLDIDTTIPWYGGAVLLPGFDVNENEVAYFGGTDCPDYLSLSSSGCSFNNAGVYWRIGTNPAGQAKTPIAMSGTAPATAGMAAERGLDPAGNVIIVAWGGVNSGAANTDSKIYYLYNNGGTPTWASASSQGLARPSIYADSALVFSHVTRKFYLFGGYHPGTAKISGETWELSLGPSGNPCTTSGTCTFTWRQLTSGTSCYPNCPQSRYSHRMTEVNYYQRNPGGSVTSNGESSCTDATAPCSYGIFMEGGTPDGTNRLADRWMFDPTANGGYGHWQLMSEMPPRNLTAMTTLDYYVPTQNRTVHRAILFGGETGLQNPQMASDNNGSTTYFVPPTLGDTWMFDFDQNSWNRVQLLGKGWMSAFPTSFASEAEARESFLSDISPLLPGIAELSPPPLAGAMMITRTVSNPTHVSGDPVTALAIPEVFLLGGRLKSGTYQGLDHVYKFCAGSTGEKPVGTSPSGAIVGGSDDATCDAYDATNNAFSPSPTQEFKGRWLRKTPAGSGITASSEASFMGGAAYDPLRDVILLYGGLKGTSLTSPEVGTEILEYTPPSKTTTALSSAEREGIWTQIPVCSGSSTPSGRYGHSLAFDTLNKQLIVVGGYSASGELHAQTVSYYDGRTFQIPEVWVAKRSTNPDCYTWSQITLFSNSIDIPAQTPPYTGLAHATSVFLPSDAFNTGFYTMLDNQCVNSGPIGVPDPSVNKLLAGGAYIDLDRTKLEDNENLLLHLTYIPMGIGNQYSDQTPLTKADEAIFKIHLVKSGLNLTDLRLAFQPRYMLFSDADKYPQIVQSISVLAPPSSGQMRQEQILLPISIDPKIDRIRIERYSGSGILIDATLFRLGKGNS